jgi:hypothetical protein
MDFSNLKEKLRNLAPLKEALLAIWSNVFSFAEGIAGRFFGGGSFNPSGEDDPRAGKKRLILLGLGGVTVLLLGLLIFIIVRNVSRSDRTGSSNIASGLSIPVEELFFPREPDFLPGFLPERERRRFWSLDDIRPYWKAPGNSVWWMEEITSTVDKFMEEVP